MALNINHAGMNMSATQAADPKTQERDQFQHFCKGEIEYHRSMMNLYEFMCANDLLAGDQPTGEMMRTIFMAGIQALAKEAK